MIKTLTSIGNSLGLIIDKPILELLKIDKDTQLEVVTDGQGLIIRPLPARGAEDLIDGKSAATTPSSADASGKSRSKQKTDTPKARDSRNSPAADRQPASAKGKSGQTGIENDRKKPEVIIEFKGKEPRRVPFVKEEMVLGREKKCDIHLDDRGLSRRHAKLENRGGSIWVSDLKAKPSRRPFVCTRVM